MLHCFMCTIIISFIVSLITVCVTFECLGLHDVRCLETQRILFRCDEVGLNLFIHDICDEDSV